MKVSGQRRDGVVCVGIMNILVTTGGILLEWLTFKTTPPYT